MNRFANRPSWNHILTISVIILATGFSCTTFAYDTPEGFFLSPGDYVAGIETEGIVQAHRHVVAPLAFLYDLNQTRVELYAELVKQAQELGGTGVTNFTVFTKVSTWTLATSFLFTVVYDFYVEGVVISQKDGNG